MEIKQFIQNQLFLVILVFTLAFGARTLYVFQKQGMHGDEVLSIILSSYNAYSWTDNYDEDKIYTGKELKEITFFESGSIIKALRDVVNLRKDNRDPPQTNLYYSLLRLWFTGQQTGDVHRIIVQGCFLNLLFFSLSFFFMYKLLKLLFNDKWLIILPLVVAFLGVGSISITNFIRPYQLQEFLFILFVYLFVYLWQKIDLKKSIDSWQNLLFIALIVSLVLLSGYFAIFFIIPFGIFLLYKLYKEKQFKNLYFIISAFLFAIALTFAIFPDYYKGFITYRGTEAIMKITGENPINNILFSLKEMFQILHVNLFYTSVLVILCIVLCYLFLVECQRLRLVFKNLMNIQPLPIILSVSLLWMSAIMIVAPEKILRYIVPAFPLLSLLIPYIISKLNSPKIYVLSLLFCVGIYGVIAFNKERIDYLYSGAYKEMKFNQEPEIPVIIYNHNYGEGGFWKNASILPYVADSQNYEFPHSDESFLEKVLKYERAILLIESTESIDVENSLSDYSLEKFDFAYSSYFNAYQIEKKP